MELHSVAALVQAGHEKADHLFGPSGQQPALEQPLHPIPVRLQARQVVRVGAHEIGHASGAPDSLDLLEDLADTTGLRRPD